MRKAGRLPYPQSLAWVLLIGALLAVYESRGEDCYTDLPVGLELQESLLGANSVDALVLGALIAEAAGSRGQPALPAEGFLSNARKVESDNTLLLQTLVNVCDGTEAGSLQSACANQPSRSLLKSDPGNGFFSIQYSAEQYGAGNSDEALATLQEAARAERISINFAEQALALTTVLKKYAPESATCAVPIASNLAASNLPDIGSMVSMCVAESQQTVDWYEACLTISRAMEAKGRSLLIVAVGLDLQITLLGDNGDAEALQSAIERKARFEAELSAFNELSEEHTLADSAAQEAWLMNVRDAGELGAVRLAVEQYR